MTPEQIVTEALDEIELSIKRPLQLYHRLISLSVLTGHHPIDIIKGRVTVPLELKDALDEALYFAQGVPTTTLLVGMKRATAKRFGVPLSAEQVKNLVYGEEKIELKEVRVIPNDEPEYAAPKTKNPRESLSKLSVNPTVSI